MPSKYCSNCKDIVSTSGFEPNFCGWCGKDLRDEPLFPEFKTYKERVELLKKYKTLAHNINLVGEGRVRESHKTTQLTLF